jgi:hypothetical protein
MPHGPEHHLEEAEHAHHASHQPFDKRVAMTMAIVAATLACVTLLSHREHNESSTMQVQSVDTWNRYQAKKNRGYLYEVEAKISEAQAANTTGPGAEKFTQLSTELKGLAQKQKNGTKVIEDEARAWEKGAGDSHHRSSFFDLGELGLELGLVLCSVAVLAKRREFWLAGVLVSVLGVIVAAYGFLAIHPQEPAGHEDVKESAALRGPGGAGGPAQRS